MNTYCGSCKTDPCLVDSGQVCCHNVVRYGYCNCPGSTWCGFCQHDPCLVVSEQVCCHDKVHSGSCQHDPVEGEEVASVSVASEPRRREHRQRSFHRPMGDRPARPSRPGR